MPRPNIIAAIDNWLFLLLLAMAVIFRLLTKAAGSKTGSSEPDESTSPRPDQNKQEARPISDEEQIRKFLEALGQPRTAKPPPPVAPRADVPPRPVAPVRPPQTMIPMPTRRAAAERDLPPPRRREAVPPPVPRTYQPRAARAPVTPAPVFEVRETAAPLPEVTPVSKSAAESAARISATDQQKEKSILDLLRSARGLREAVILREILGPPRGMQPFEFSGVA
jgi:hypothetical protein